MLSVAFLIFLILQITLAGLDLWDLWPKPSIDEHQDPPQTRSLVFLVAVTLVFLAVQFGGSGLMPPTWDIFEFSRSMVAPVDAATHEISGITAFIAAVMIFYIAGFWDYVVHRVFSHSRWFWFTHEYHHLPRHVLVLMPGILARPFASIPTAMSTLATALSLYWLLALLRLPLWNLEPIIPTLLAIAVVLTASHSSFLRRRPIVHRIMSVAFLTTPQEHLLHHAVNVQGNYGNFTTLWDRIFATYLDPKGVVLDEVRLGLSYDQDFLGTLTLGKWKLPPAVRRHFQIDRYCNIDEQFTTRCEGGDEVAL